MKFAILSDPQIGHRGQEELKRNSIALIEREKPEFLLIPGDLTDTARAGSIINYIFKKIFFSEEEFKIEYQLQKFHKMFKPVKCPVFAVMGNHDTYNGPINWVKLYQQFRFGGRRYKRKIGNTVIYGCHIHPNRHTMKWLRKNYDERGILMFHYPPTSDDFTNNLEWDKWLMSMHDAGKLPTMIAVGHFHRNDILPISKNKKIREIIGDKVKVVCAGGEGLCVVEDDKIEFLT